MKRKKYFVIVKTFAGTFRILSAAKLFGRTMWLRRYTYVNRVTGRRVVVERGTYEEISAAMTNIICNISERRNNASTVKAMTWDVIREVEV